MPMSQVTLLDGGMGRELSRMGAPFRLPEWSALALMEAPELVRAAHDAFAAAGADVLTANSYALTPHHLGQARFEAQGQALADRAGRLAQSAARNGVRVAGSLPPLFGSYRPAAFDAGRALSVLQPLVAGLAPYADLWLVETTSSVAEMHAALDACARALRPIWVSYTVADGIGRRGPPALRSGEAIDMAVAAALARGAEAILFNCSQAEAMLAAVEIATAVTGARAAVGVYANAFEPEPEGVDTYAGISEMRADLGAAAYVTYAQRWARAGATVIGGCCGIGPGHIAALRSWRDSAGVAPARVGE